MIFFINSQNILILKNFSHTFLLAYALNIMITFIKVYDYVSTLCSQIRFIACCISQLLIG